MARAMWAIWAKRAANAAFSHALQACKVVGRCMSVTRMNAIARIALALVRLVLSEQNRSQVEKHQHRGAPTWPQAIGTQIRISARANGIM